MSLRIGTNVASLATQRSMNISQKNTEKAVRELASGTRFSNIGADAAGFAISEHLKGQIKGIQAAKGNAQNAQSFIQVAEGGLNEQNNILIRMRELAIQSASDTYSDTEREFMQMEFGQLNSELDRIAKTTQFGSTKLLTGTGKNYDFQVGAYGGAENRISYTLNSDTTADALGIGGLTVESQDDAIDSLENIDQALTQIAQSRAQFGAIQSRFDSVINNQGVQIENLQAAHSRLSDTDVAQAVSEMVLGQVQQQFQTALLAQANQQPNYALKLLMG